MFDNLSPDFQFVENREWLRGYANFRLGIDGISILFILLTALIIPICVLSVISSIKSRLKEFLVTLLVFRDFNDRSFLFFRSCVILFIF